jgi:hypothetical protein
MYRTKRRGTRTLLCVELDLVSLVVSDDEEEYKKKDTITPKVHDDEYPSH